MKTGIMLVVLAVMGMAVASAQPGEGKRPDGKKMKAYHEKLMQELDLTSEQEAALKEAQEAFREKAKGLHQGVKAARDQMRDVMKNTSASRDDVMQAIEAESAAELSLRKAMAEHRLQVRDIIGPENAEKMIEMREKNRDRDGDDRGEKRGPRDDDERKPRRD